VFGIHNLYSACVNATDHFATPHHRQAIRGYTAMDMDFLENLFNNNILPNTEECGIFEPLASRRKYCGKQFLTSFQAVSN
jgi:hypothetical protein